MATQKPRITISLDRDVYDTIRGLSDAQGCTMSGLISEFLTMVNPVQQRVLQAVKKAQSLNVESKADMVASLEASEAQLTEMLGPLLALMDQLEGGEPPHSNTGVTNSTDGTKNEKKTASKVRSRALREAEEDAEFESAFRGFVEAGNDLGKAREELRADLVNLRRKRTE